MSSLLFVTGSPSSRGLPSHLRSTWLDARGEVRGSVRVVALQAQSNAPPKSPPDARGPASRPALSFLVPDRGLLTLSVHPLPDAVGGFGLATDNG